MIKIFDCVHPWPNKVNFIQDNPMVFVGYDMVTQCCESYGWCIEGATIERDGTLPNHVFDTSMPPLITDAGEKTLAHFRLIGKRKRASDEVVPDATLILWCEHNGYYSHGWAMVSGETMGGSL